VNAFGVPDGDGGMITLHIEGLDRTAWAALVNEHPSDDPRWRWNQETLYPALVQACVTEPRLELADAARLVEDPDVGADLIDGCLQLSAPGDFEWARRRLASDPRLFAEVAAAVRMGIGHHQFTGWPVASQDLALAWIEQDTQARCPGCGVPQADMTKPMAWEPDVLPCAHCDTRETAARSIRENDRHREHVVLVRAVT